MAKFIAQLIVTGTQVVGRAFVRALRQEYEASQEAAKRYAQHSPSGNNQHSQTTIDIKTGISLQESIEILNVSPKLQLEEIEKKFNHLYTNNDVTKGGSVYIQAKVLNAKERIVEELQRRQEEETAKKKAMAEKDGQM